MTSGDIDGARATIQAIRLFHPEVAYRVCFLVVDRRPERSSAAGAEALEDAGRDVRYVRLAGREASAARDLVLRAAGGDLSCAVDAPALAGAGGLATLLAWHDDHPAADGRAPGAPAIGWVRPPETNPFAFFDGIFCLNLDAATVRRSEAARRHERLGIGSIVERFPGFATPDNPHRGIALSFRAMIVEARRRGYEHVLILEDDAVFLDDAATVMRAATAELGGVEWDLCYLGACVWSQEFPFLADSSVLQVCGPVTCTHAVAVHRRAYDRLLAEIPTAPDELAGFLRDDLAIDQYLSRRIRDGTYRAVITWPRVASQPNLLDFDDGDGALAERYVF